MNEQNIMIVRTEIRIGDDDMIKNYPATYLFFLSLVTLMILTFITPIIGTWHIFCTIALKIIIFILKVICAFFLFGTIIEAINGIKALVNGMISRKK